jgi:hypothetical protein
MMAGASVPCVSMDPLTLYATELQALLAPGESAIAAANCQLAFGADRLERSPAEMERLAGALPQPLRDRALAALRAETQPEKAWDRVISVLVGADSIVRFDVDAALGGVAATGHVGSCAARFVGPLRGHSSNYCVVTDRRIMLAAMEPNPIEFRGLAELPRGAVLTARREGRLLQRGRVVIDFVDLSRLALMTGIFGTNRADALVEAMTGAP